MSPTHDDAQDLPATYELARDELIELVRQLEAGGISLEDSMRLWERGELLAKHCEQFLDGAQRRLDTVTAASEDIRADSQTGAPTSRDDPSTAEQAAKGTDH